MGVVGHVQRPTLCLHRTEPTLHHSEIDHPPPAPSSRDAPFSSRPTGIDGPLPPPTLEPVLRRTVSRDSTAAHTISGVRWQNFAAARERNHCRHAGAHQLHSHSPRADPRDSTSRWLAKNSRIEVLGGCPRYSRMAQRFPSVSGSIHNSKTPLFQPLQITSIWFFLPMLLLLALLTSVYSRFSPHRSAGLGFRRADLRV